MKVNATQIPSVLRSVAELFSKHKADVRPVGGCVRDLVVGRTPKDWDCATNAVPYDTFSILDKAGFKPYDISNGHGTVSFNYEDETYEITTLRLDTQTDGRHATVEFISDFQRDAARRDFTINAMSCDPTTGFVYDYFNGIEDIQRGCLRFVGNAVRRIEEDYLRILRYFRFLGKMDMLDNINQIAMAACAAGKQGLDQISGERIWMEVRQIMSDPQHRKIMTLMTQTGVAEQLNLVYR